MKYLLLALFAVAAVAAPTPDESEPVELIVNGVPEGQPLDIGDVLGIQVKEHTDGVVASQTDLLYPLSSAGIAEAAAAQIADDNVLPVSVVENDQAVDVQVDAQEDPAIILPAPETPEVFEPMPESIPSPIMPEPMPPVQAPEPEPPVYIPLPEPAPQVPSGEVYNDGLVQVQVNTPEDTGILTTIQSWFSLLVNYVSNGAQTSQQIV